MRFSALLLSGLLLGLTAQGQTIQRCAADEVYAHEVARDPQREAFRAETEAEMQRVQQLGMPESVVHQIPVVFHVMHYDQGDNISEAQILSALQILNEDMRRTNPDTGNLRALFKGVAADMEVEFVLANKGPNGECTNGINRQLFLPFIKRLEEELSDLLTAQVEIRIKKQTKRHGKVDQSGELSIAFGSIESLNGLIDKLQRK